MQIATLFARRRRIARLRGNYHARDWIAVQHKCVTHTSRFYNLSTFGGLASFSDSAVVCTSRCHQSYREIRQRNARNPKAVKRFVAFEGFLRQKRKIFPTSTFKVYVCNGINVYWQYCDNFGIFIARLHISVH